MKYILYACALLFPLGSFAQKSRQDSIFITGSLKDSFTRRPLSEGLAANVELLRNDSTILSTTTTYDDRNNRQRTRFTGYTLSIAATNRTNFILRVSAEGYKTAYIPISMSNRRNGNPIVTLPDIFIRRSIKSEQRLDEVVVTATKIKLYNRGDTIVYNADAFQLQEGSMLDALIAQLPGVVLKPDGRIYVNGKYVESLLLNGKDVFKRDNTVLLDNLPAYMVSNIQVYKKEDERYKGLGLGRDIDGGRLVVDVKLKRKYSLGHIANAEGGYGSDGRYLGRLFAMRYTPSSNMTLFGNINNVNARREPDGKGNWGDIDPSGGVTVNKHAGFSYNVSDKDDCYSLGGNAQVQYTDNTQNSEGTSVDFLPGGDLYSVRRQHSQNSNIELSTDHYLNMLIAKRARLNLSPWINHQKTTAESSLLNGMFSNMPSDGYNTMLDSLASPFWEKTLLDIIRRNMEQSVGDTRHTQGGIPMMLTLALPNKNAVILNVTPAFDNRRSHSFSRFSYNHYAGGELQTDSRNRYDRAPQSRFDIKGQITHMLRWNWFIRMETSYKIEHDRSNGDQLHYRLDKLEESAGKPLGWCADSESLASVLDTDNSYMSTTRVTRHTLAIDWQLSRFKKDRRMTPVSGWIVKLRPSVTMEHGRYNFDSSPQPQTVSRSYALPQLYAKLARHFLNGKKYIELEGKYDSHSPSLTSLVNKTFAYNPVNITLGNPDLKKYANMRLALRFGWGNGSTHQLTMDMSLDRPHHAIGSKYVYDKSTGVKTSQPVNVEGNWNTGATVGYWRWLDKRQHLMLTSNGYVQYMVYDNLASPSLSQEPSCYTTKRVLVYESLGIDCRFKKVSFGIKCTADYNHVTSSNVDFTGQNTLALRYGGNMRVGLPWHFQLSTDLTMYSRHGYESSAMNRNDLVWNARLSRSILANKLSLVIEAWDILGNLSNVNAGYSDTQHWEYYTNVIPRYAMARIVYKFAKQPKKH